MDETVILERMAFLKEQLETACSSTHFGKAAERARQVQIMDLYQRAKILEATKSLLLTASLRDSF